MKEEPLRRGDMEVCGEIWGVRTKGHIMTLYIEDDGWWHEKVQFSDHWASELADLMKLHSIPKSSTPPHKMNNTVSLEVAKMLDKAGWEKETSFLWGQDMILDRENRDHLSTGFVLHPDQVCKHKTEDFLYKPIAAPQMHEILEELPTMTALQYVSSGLYAVWCDENIQGFNHKNPHNACALLWLWCKENKYI